MSAGVVLRAALRDPLVHFLAAGAALFAVFGALDPRGAAPANPRRIEVTADELRQLSMAWIAQGRPAPTEAELRGLVESRVREEILVREALELGLDQGDAIVRRRLAQKMEFLVEDLAALREPGAEELSRWFEAHAEEFQRPARATFRQLYFSPDRRGASAREDAARALASLDGAAVDAPAAQSLADPFPFQEYYGDRSAEDIAKSFGPAFATALLASAPGAWQGPIESGYGWHLVFVDSITPPHVPVFEEIRGEVHDAWIEAQRKELRARAFASMRERYEVVLPDPADAAPPRLAATR